MNRNEFADAKRPIDGKAVWVYILLHWKSLLCVTVLFFVFGFGRNYKNMHAAEAAAPTGSTSDSSFYSSALSNLNGDIARKKSYMSNSILGQIDTDHQGSASASLWVEDSNNQGMTTVCLERDENGETYCAYKMVDDNASAVIESLDHYLSSGFDWDSIAQTMGVEDGRYLQEVVKTENNGDSLSLEVVYTSKDGAEQLLNAVVDELVKKGNSIISSNSSLGTCTISVLDRSSSDTVSIPKSEWIAEQIKVLKDLYDQRSVLSDLQTNNSNQGTTNGAGFTVKGGVKAGIKFGILGIVLYVVLLLLKLLGGNRVLTARELNDCYKTESLAVMSRNSKYKSSLSRRILMMDAENMDGLSEEESLEAAGERLKKSPLSKFALIGDMDQAKMKKTADALSRYSGKEVTACGGVLSSLEQRKEADACEGAVLAVERGKSSYKVLNAILSIITIPVTGTVVF